VDTNVVILILGLVFLGSATVLVWRGQLHGSGGGVSLSLGEMLKVKVKLPTENAARAGDAISRAEQERGLSDNGGRSVQIGHSTMTARILWVDDKPDNNLYETLALENLGKFITKTTHTESAFAYLSSGLDFALVITDLGRFDDPEAGTEFIRSARASGYKQPIVVYTVGAERVRDTLRAVGADAVVDTPVALIDEVENRIG
jgi:CheY-like chemotaxis protein